MNPGNRKKQKGSSDSQRFVSWLEDADFLRPNVMTILSDTLSDVTTAGIYSEDQIAAFVARHSLRWRIPARFLPSILRFLVEFQKSVSQPDEETRKYLQYIKTSPLPRRCYTVFYNGQECFCFDELPEHILKCRETVLFWIYEPTNDFSSRGRARKKLEPQTLRVLRFLCDNKNAGRTVTLAELYSDVWRKEPASFRKMVGSVEVETSKLNTFADKKFEYRTGTSAIITRIGDSYRISNKAPNECCIISAITTQGDESETSTNP
jgi:hypothetical protein